MSSARNGLAFSVRRASMWIHQWNRFKRWQEAVKDREDSEKEKSLLTNTVRFPTGMYLTPEKPEQVLPKKDPADMTRKDTGALPMDLLTNHTQMRYIDHSFENIKRVRRYNHFTHLQYDQRLIPERILFLGPDLAAAHFLVHRGAAVKFLNDDTWYKRDAKKNYSLPGRKVPGLCIEAIDASGTELLFEGLENLDGLEHLRLLRVAGCKYMDDWCVSRIGALMPTLTMLDLSGCTRITANGLMGLRPLKSLKYLRIEGLNNIKEVGKSCLLLEESIPSLSVLGVDYTEQLEDLIEEMLLLRHPSVVQDARGNAFAEDDNGRLFYISGKVNERPVVTDDDHPIVTSTIRRELPAMSDEEFNEVDRLSKGKLRHLLVGSPSGYEWTKETEIILQHEAQRKLARGIPVNNKLLPKERREDGQLQGIVQQEKKQLLAQLDTMTIKDK